SAAGGIAYSSAANEEVKAAQQKPASAKQQAGKEDKESVTYSGRVLDPDGKPLAGAKVYLLDQSSAKEPPKVRATTDADGRFGFTIARADIKLISYMTNPWYG